MWEKTRTRCHLPEGATLAGIEAIHSVGASLESYLQAAYPTDLSADHPCTFKLVSSKQLESMDTTANSILSILLYRVTRNRHLHNAGPTLGAPLGPLSLDLHYLISVWADKPDAEQVIAAWVMLELHRHPILDAASLTPDGDWTDQDVLQILPEELSNEDLMRIWDALGQPYRLSIPYVIRVVRIQPVTDGDGAPVVVTRYDAHPRLAEEDAS
ncbi:MAG: DUF4255 domain-containing protein [Alphaproteobacteria bacterium]|nr:DUF4255 domain-containing protein [Alphaproteobacteria bacterium]